MGIVETITGVATGSLAPMLVGGGVRALWGEISSWWTRRQDHKYELERMEVQAKLDEKSHAQRMEMARFEADQKVQIIRMQADVDLSKLGASIELEDAKNFGQATIAALKPVGIWFVDAWNAAIRPAAATFSLVLWWMAVHQAQWVLTQRDWELIYAILGFFLADRTLGKKGK